LSISVLFSLTWTIPMVSKNRCFTESRPGPNLSAAAPKLCDPGPAVSPGFHFHIGEMRVTTPAAWIVAEINWEYTCGVISTSQSEKVLKTMINDYKWPIL
jgi:hypothetical protein